MRYYTAGESHGSHLVAIVDGVPAGLKISQESINSDLRRRQGGYGRGGRQAIESDKVQIISGMRYGKSIGSPIALLIANKDHENWTQAMSIDAGPHDDSVRISCPRPGHADLVGALKIDSDDCRDILERSSARETAARVAATGIAREFLADVGVEIYSYVTSIGSARLREHNFIEESADYKPLEIELSDVRCPNDAASDAMRKEIDKAREEGDSLGGTFRVVARGLVPGLGGYASGSERLTSRIAARMMSIPAMKGIEFGLGFEGARLPGSMVHDEIVLDKGKAFMRTTNNAGGLEGGMSTGMPLIITCAMKPIPTLTKPLSTINLDTLEATKAASERSDVCAVPAAAVVAEGELAYVLAQAYLEKFGSDTMSDIKDTIAAYKERLLRAAR